MRTYLFLCVASFAIVSANVATLNAGFETIVKALAYRAPNIANTVSGLRTEATTGYGQVVVYGGSTCSGTPTLCGDFQLGACVPFALNGGDKGTIITASGSTVTITGYSDLACSVVSGTPLAVPTGCSAGTSVNVYTGSTVPPSAFTTKYFQAR